MIAAAVGGDSIPWNLAIPGRNPGHNNGPLTTVRGFNFYQLHVLKVNGVRARRPIGSIFPVKLTVLALAVAAASAVAVAAAPPTAAVAATAAATAAAAAVAAATAEAT